MALYNLYGSKKKTIFVKKTMKSHILYILLILCTWSACTETTSQETSKDALNASPNSTSSTSPSQVQRLSQRIEKDSTNAELYYTRSNFYLQENNLENAASDVLKAMELEPENGKYYQAASEILLNINDSRSAITMLQRGLSIKPQDVGIRLQLAKVLLYVRQYEQAENHLDFLLQLDKANPQALFYKALISKEQDDPQKTIANLEKAVEADPDYYEAFIQLALIYSDKKDPITLQYLDNALRIDPQSIEALYAKGFFLQQNNKYNEAKAEYKKIMKINPQYEFALYNIGYLLLQQDSVDLAQKHFNMAIGVSPAYANAYQMRGLTSEIKGDIEAAIRDYEQALTFKKDHPKALEGIKRLSKK